MKIINYDRGLVAKNIENLRAKVLAHNKKKNSVTTIVKSIICAILVTISAIGFLYTQTHEITNIFPVLGSFIGIATALATILFSIAITDVSDCGWLKQRTFEMLYHDLDSKGQIASIQKHKENKSIVVSWLDENKYVSTTEIALNNVLVTPTVDEDTLDVAHGTLLCHFDNTSNITYAE